MCMAVTRGAGRAQSRVALPQQRERRAPRVLDGAYFLARDGGKKKARELSSVMAGMAE